MRECLQNEVWICRPYLAAGNDHRVLADDRFVAEDLAGDDPVDSLDVMSNRRRPFVRD